MDTERFRQRTQNFLRAVERLDEACAQEENSFIRDSVIQRFEFCYELAWKMLKLRLEKEDIDARSPKAVLQESLQQGYIQDGNLWTELHRMRNETSHTYDESLAINVYQFIHQTGLGLFKQLAEKSRYWLSSGAGS